MDKNGWRSLLGFFKVFQKLAIQFGRPNYIPVSCFGRWLFIEHFRIGFPKVASDTRANIMFLVGFGSGGIGAAPLAAHLAARDYIVDLISFPGYGRSSPMPGEYKKTKSYDVEADIIRQVIDHLKLHNPLFIGHSAGCLPIAEFLRENPTFHASAILLAPAGVTKRNGWLTRMSLAATFMKSGKQLRDYHNKHKQFREQAFAYRFEDLVGQQPFPFRPSLISYRLAELKKICLGLLPGILADVSQSITGIWLENDIVCPFQESTVLKRANAQIRIEFMRGLSHNPTVFYPDCAIMAQKIEELWPTRHE